ncbi:hypothetical protein RRG08_000050 [Elysia crispata]|uniref:Uncharacterized protein n=1 Tax=Elysia crispata TaxID=231223 RepID=A0AAE0Y6S9_9GAST|nr:hypothetical protein RRG08_000050 [Elysia crispata]
MADRETEYNTELTKIRHTNYVRNSRAIVVLWAFFTIVFLILNVVVLIQPQWIGDSDESAVGGFFGLYRRCEEMSIGDDFVCSGDIVEFDSILNSYFKACSVMVGISCLLFIFCVGCFFLFLLLNTATVLQTCAWFQLLSGILMGISCVLYPAGWDDPIVQVVCGLKADKYDLGLCDVRWGYILAIVLVFDAFILSILAFVLAAKQANLMPEVYKLSEKGWIQQELNLGSTQNLNVQDDSPPTSLYHPQQHHYYDGNHHKHHEQHHYYDGNHHKHHEQHHDHISSGDYTEHHYMTRQTGRVAIPIYYTRSNPRRLLYHEDHVFVVD